MIPMTTNVVAAQADRFRGQNPSRKRAGPLVSFTPAPGDVASHSRVLRFPKRSGEVDSKRSWPTRFSRAMSELGIRQIFSHSPHAKGWVERVARTFQDRLVTELRLAGPKTMDDANAVLREFLVRFNEKFGVCAQQPKVACRPLEQSPSLERIFCFKHRRKVARDNTVKYRWRTLQLLPGRDRPSYAGVTVEVLGDLDGQLSVRYRGETIPTQEVPARPGFHRAYSGALRYGPDAERRVNGVGNRHDREFAILEPVDIDIDSGDGAKRGGNGRARRPAAAPRRKPNAETAGTVERGAAGQASRPLHSGNRQGDRHPQEHGQEVR